MAVSNSSLTRRGVAVFVSCLAVACGGAVDGGPDATSDAAANAAPDGDSEADAAAPDAAEADDAATCNPEGDGAQGSCCVAKADCADPINDCCILGVCTYCGLR
jgi:hypothetical protein